MDSTPATAYIPAAMTDPKHAPSSNPAPSALNGPLGVVRTIVGGVLMGIANLIPGISGGTMILAMGLYSEFIDSVADVSRLRLSPRRIGFLGVLGGAAVVSIFGLAGVILYLLFHYNAAMYALFIGLTLGGAPKLASMLRSVRAAWVAIVLGIALMAGIAVVKDHTGGLPNNTVMDVFAGVIGAITMVLPGVSGSLMLQVLGQYDRVIGAIHDLSFAIIIPVGIGAVVGVVILSNALKYLLHHYQRATIGLLLGMLLGSPLVLWPFGQKPGQKALENRNVAERRALAEKHGVPRVAEAPDSELVTVIRENWKDRTASDYRPGDIAAVGVMLVIGFAGTFVLARDRDRGSTDSEAPVGMDAH